MKKILLVDDDDALRKTLSHILRDAGYAVEEASNGAIALNSYGRAPSDLVITDLIMPDREGLETIRELRRLYSGVRIIAISGGGFGEARAYLDCATAFGADRTIAKPFARDEVLSAVAEVLGTDI
jgi:CheY-like chemotaxis protein